MAETMISIAINLIYLNNEMSDCENFINSISSVSFGDESDFTSYRDP